MTERKGWGGARTGAGRKGHMDEQAQRELMDAKLSPEEFWNIAATIIKSKDRERGAVLQLWAKHRFSVPTTTVNNLTDGVIEIIRTNSDADFSSEVRATPGPEANSEGAQEVQRSEVRTPVWQNGT